MSLYFDKLVAAAQRRLDRRIHALIQAQQAVGDAEMFLAQRAHEREVKVAQVAHRRPLPRAERTLAIEAALREAAVDGRLPNGVLTAIAAEHGLTKERIRQLAVRIGLRGPKGLRLRWACEMCGSEHESKPSEVKRWCSRACSSRARAIRQSEEHVCPECGETFVMDRMQLTRMRQNLKSGLIRFTDGYQPSCSRRCGTRNGIRKRDALRRAS